MKNQSKCYRNIDGKLYFNYADLIYGDEENKVVEMEVKDLYKYYRKIKHSLGYYQIFVSND